MKMILLISIVIGLTTMFAANARSFKLFQSTLRVKETNPSGRLVDTVKKLPLVSVEDNRQYLQDSIRNLNVKIDSSKLHDSLGAKMNSVFSKVKKELDSVSRVATLSFKSGNLSNPIRVDSAVLETLNKNRLNNLNFSTEFNQLDIESSSQIYYQQSLSTVTTFKGVPLSFNTTFEQSRSPQGTKNRIQYRFNYSKEDFLSRLKVDREKKKREMSNDFSFDKKVNMNQLTEAKLKSDSATVGLLRETGCDSKDLMNLSLSEFKKKYKYVNTSTDINKQQTLKKYYQEYSIDHPKTGVSDSLLKQKIKETDKNISLLRTNSDKYQRLLFLKKKTDSLTAGMAPMKKKYNKKLKEYISNYDVADDIKQQDTTLKPFQKFMLNVKRLDFGQHALDIGNLTVKNYVHNGVTFEYEAHKFSVMLTAGSQRNIRMPGLFFAASPAMSINQYYQYNSLYNLIGGSVKFGNSSNFQQVSLMHYTNAGNSHSEIVPLNVLTVANQLALGLTNNLSWELSSSLTVPPVTGSTIKGNNGTAFQRMAGYVRFETSDEITHVKQKVDLQYADAHYKNPGLNSGYFFPGWQTSYRITKVGRLINVDNQVRYNDLGYAGGASLKILNEKTQISYKLKKARIGLLLSGNMASQANRSDQVGYRSKGMDILGTSSFYRNLGEATLNLNTGVGVGLSYEAESYRSRSMSFFLNSTYTNEYFALGIDLDKLSSHTSEVYLIDSSVSVLQSTLNFSSYLSYTGKKGNRIQSGILLKEYNNSKTQTYITAESEWKILQRISIIGVVSIPIQKFDQKNYVNNVFNFRVKYNIIGNEK